MSFGPGEEGLPAPPPGVLERLFPGRQAMALGVLQGAINTLWRVALRLPAEQVLLRARLRDAEFPYEQGIVKEAHLAWALAGRPGRPPPAGIPMPWPVALGGLLPEILWYDETRLLLPVPFTILVDRPGRLLADCPEPALYHALGGLLARLHATRFAGFHDRLDRLGAAPERDWRRIWRAGLERAAGRLPPEDPLRRRLLHLPDLPESLAARARPVLVHNDLHGRNVLVDPERRLWLIDWDNALIDVPELDWVKLRHWTRHDGNGLLVPDPGLAEAALAGCLGAGGIAPDPQILDLAELLWLARVVAYQTARGGAPPGFLPTEVYRRQLASALDGLAWSAGS